ncbi:MAG: NUDIX domain-containing protein [bacterium]
MANDRARNAGTPNPPVIHDSEVLAEGQWMRLRRIRYADSWGAARIWESAERCNDRGTVVILARLQPGNELLLVRQYRPPVEAWTIEFPAGLVDDEESPEQTARRELREETGYCADRVRLLPPALSSPGLTNEAAQFALVYVFLDRAQNKAPRQQLEGSEDIEVFRVCESELDSFLADQRALGVRIDMRVLAFAVGRTSAG